MHEVGRAVAIDSVPTLLQPASGFSAGEFFTRKDENYVSFLVPERHSAGQ